MKKLLLILCLLPQVCALAFQTEFFPWSHFPMYSGKPPPGDFHLISAYVEKKDGGVVPIESLIALRPKYEYRRRLKASKVWKETRLSEEERHTLENFSSIFARDLQALGLKDSPAKILFYVEYWTDFSGPQRLSPDEKRRIFEYSIP